MRSILPVARATREPDIYLVTPGAAPAPIRRRHEDLRRDPGDVVRVLADGAERTRETAADTVRRSREAIGLLV
jgi:hypothetical protein